MREKLSQLPKLRKYSLGKTGQVFWQHHCSCLSKALTCALHVASIS
jgi:hypothetical protein